MHHWRYNENLFSSKSRIGSAIITSIATSTTRTFASLPFSIVLSEKHTSAVIHEIVVQEPH